MPSELKEYSAYTLLFTETELLIASRHDSVIYCVELDVVQPNIARTIHLLELIENCEFFTPC